ncbi:MAG: ComF family protein [Cyanobacteria bacterium]|nr:ComF family protein [Cyanobacteriota bacterium]
MWSQATAALSQLWLAARCPLCDRSPAQPFCDSCWRQIQACHTATPATLEADALTVLSWGRYERPLKGAIAALKYDGHRTVADPLGRALGEWWQQHPIPTRQPPWVVPIPLHEAKQRQRGFNQAALIAAAFCRQTGLPLQANGLRRQRATLPQFGLGAAERQENVANAFAMGHWPRPQRQRPIVLLDDIYTTGTTVRAAATVLRRAGWSVCGVVTVARTQSDQ